VIGDTLEQNPGNTQVANRAIRTAAITTTVEITITKQQHIFFLLTINFLKYNYKIKEFLRFIDSYVKSNYDLIAGNRVESSYHCHFN
jgi:hypothetical protein